MENYIDIPIYAQMKKYETINKGFSGDQKFLLTLYDDTKLLLRIAKKDQYKSKYNESEILKCIADMGIPASRIVDFGFCGGGKNVYQLLTWIEGSDGDNVLPLLSKIDQYHLGVKAGEILCKLQTLDRRSANENWSIIYNKIIDKWILAYQECGLSFYGDTTILDFITEYRHFLNRRPMVLTHDDYTPSNMIVDPISGELSIIDFHNIRYSDPWKPLSGVVFCNQCLSFARGEIHGYFPNEPPKEFWSLLALYMAVHAIHLLPRLITLGEEKIAFAHNQIKNILNWYDNFSRVLPSWYLDN